MYLRRLAIAVVIALGSLPAAAASAGDAHRGQKLFMRDGCYLCHGTRGAGGGIVGPRLAPDPLPFAAVLMQLRMPAERMPLYTAKVLPDADAADIYAYLQSIPQGRPAARIPLLDLSGSPRH